MVTCQSCGFEVEDGSKFCRHCGSEIIIEEETVDNNETKFCANCGFEMPKSTKFCPECGSSTDNAPKVVNNVNNSVVNSDKNPVLAAILSFLIVGLGQIYLGLNKKGIILFVAAVISGVLMLFIIGWITWLLVWGYAIYDAYNSCEKICNGIPVEDTIDINNLF